MSLGTLQDAAASAPLVAVVSLVSTLPTGAWARVSTQAGQLFSTNITTTNWHQCGKLLWMVEGMLHEYPFILTSSREKGYLLGLCSFRIVG